MNIRPNRINNRNYMLKLNKKELGFCKVEERIRSGCKENKGFREKKKKKGLELWQQRGVIGNYRAISNPR